MHTPETLQANADPEYRARIEAARVTAEWNAAEPFIVNLTHQGGDRNESLNEPFRTVTGAQFTPIVRKAAA